VPRMIVAVAILAALPACTLLFYEHRLPSDYVQLYPGAEHQYQLRIPFRVQGNANIHDPLTPYDYPSSTWIPLNGNASELSAQDSDALVCPEGTKTFSSRYPVRGRVQLVGPNAIVDLEIYRRDPSGVAAWRPYEFNKTYHLEWTTQDPMVVVRAEKADCRK
jgi:hypothetical protein